jgi:hypothetical protein
MMIDLETTGTSPEHTAIIQIAAVKFDITTGEISHDFFNRCLSIPNTRRWDEDTRQWWSKMSDQLRGIYGRMEEPAKVMEEFYWWLGGPSCQLHTWAKPLSFEFPFLSSYFKEFGPAMPLDFRKGRDLWTFMDGLNFPYTPFNEKSVPFDGVVHDALFDTLHQVRLLFAAIDAPKETLIEG